MGVIAENVKRVRAEMEEAALRAGADPASVLLVAASKTKGPPDIREAIAAGVDAVGENRTVELTEKQAQGAYTGAPLHFIGRLQHNKLRFVVGQADLIQSVDSVALLRRVGQRAVQLGVRQDILLQVNIGREESKGGLDPAAVDEAAALAGTLDGLRLMGLMAIPPAWEAGGSGWPGSGKYPYFDEMYQLFVDIKGKKYDNICMRFLSMGMSGDFAEAIGAGANMVRVGSAIFGARPPRLDENACR